MTVTTRLWCLVVVLAATVMSLSATLTAVGYLWAAPGWAGGMVSTAVVGNLVWRREHTARR